jgi:hypothetical protein
MVTGSGNRWIGGSEPGDAGFVLLMVLSFLAAASAIAIAVLLSRFELRELSRALRIASDSRIASMNAATRVQAALEAQGDPILAEGVADAGVLIWLAGVETMVTVFSDNSSLSLRASPDDLISRYLAERGEIPRLLEPEGSAEDPLMDLARRSWQVWATISMAAGDSFERDFSSTTTEPGIYLASATERLRAAVSDLVWQERRSSLPGSWSSAVDAPPSEVTKLLVTISLEGHQHRTIYALRLDGAHRAHWVGKPVDLP